MSHLSASNLAYAHPGGSTLFEGVSFKIPPGAHVGVVGVNGVGKSTLMRVIIGALGADEGDVATGGLLAYMPQDVGVTGDPRSVRELLLELTMGSMRDVGGRMIRAEKALAAGDAEAGMALGEAIGEWSELGGYELEGQWDAACRRIVRRSFAELAERPAITLSGGERKRLLLDVLMRSEADILLLDEPDNFLDIPAKRELEDQLRRTKKTVLVISHDRDLLSRAVNVILTLEGNGAWLHHGSYATYPQAREDRQQKLGDAVTRWNERRDDSASWFGSSRSGPATHRIWQSAPTRSKHAGTVSRKPGPRRRRSPSSRSRFAFVVRTPQGGSSTSALSGFRGS